MRLIHTRTFEFFEPEGDNVVSYTILSHRWGKDEVTYQDRINPERKICEKRGYDKWHKFLLLSRALGFEYAWLDTCCINKDSSAELNEAINSMYSWYSRSSRCIVYLADVEIKAEMSDLEDEDEVEESESDDEDSFGNQASTQRICSTRYRTTDGCVELKYSAWFKRGWTLQELIAPTELSFYDRNWLNFSVSYAALSKITGIPKYALQGQTQDMCVAEKMHWASRRSTTRGEGIAYCLMELFNVNMPLLYGEGQTKAFMRLQEEIIRRSDDETIFIWSAGSSQTGSYRGIFARHPSEFTWRNIKQYRAPLPETLPYSLTNSGLSMFLKLLPFTSAPFLREEERHHALVAGELPKNKTIMEIAASSTGAADLHQLYIPILHCGQWLNPLSVILKKVRNNAHHFVRVWPETVVHLDYDQIIKQEPQEAKSVIYGFLRKPKTGAVYDWPATAQVYVYPSVTLRDIYECQPMSGFYLYTTSRNIVVSHGYVCNDLCSWTGTVLNLIPNVTHPCGLVRIEFRRPLVISTRPLSESKDILEAAIEREITSSFLLITAIKKYGAGDCALHFRFYEECPALAVIQTALSDDRFLLQRLNNASWSLDNDRLIGRVNISDDLVKEFYSRFMISRVRWKKKARGCASPQLRIA